MKRNSALTGSLLLAGVMFLSACGGGQSSSSGFPPPGGGGGGGGTGGGGGSTAPLYLFIRDTPPAGVTVLTFEISVTSAVLQPGNIPLVSVPVDLELRHLEADSRPLGFARIASGAYTALTVTLANPKITIQNNSGAAIGSCAPGAICELRPSLSSSSVTLSDLDGLPLFNISTSPVVLTLDFDLANSVSDNLAQIDPAIFIESLELAEGEEVDVGELVGLVTDSPQPFMEEGVFSFTVATDFGPVLVLFAGTAADITPGQIVEIRGQMTGFGAPSIVNAFVSARRVTLRISPDAAVGPALRGIVVAVPDASHFDIVVFDEMGDAPGVAVGNLVRMNVSPDSVFAVEDIGTAGAGFNFSGIPEVMAGQAVTVRLASGANPSGTPPALDFSRVELREGSLTVKIGAIVDADHFTVEGLTGILSNTQINVTTSADTNFENAANVSELNVGDTVSLRGLLFKTSVTPVLVASLVRRQ